MIRGKSMKTTNKLAGAGAVKQLGFGSMRYPQTVHRYWVILFQVATIGFPAFEIFLLQSCST